MSQVVDLGSMHHLVVVVILIIVIWLLIRKVGLFDPVDCKMKAWVDDGKCDLATGKLKQTRAVEQQPKYGGKACPTDLSQTVDCKVDCQYGTPWTVGTACDTTSNKLYETNTITFQPKNGGVACITDTTNAMRRRISSTACPAPAAAPAPAPPVASPASAPPVASPPAATPPATAPAPPATGSTGSSGSSTAASSGFYGRREGYNARMYEGMYPHEPPVVANTGYDENTNTGYIDDISSIESFSNRVKGPYE
jgi:hypothetical protein